MYLRTLLSIVALAIAAVAAPAARAQMPVATVSSAIGTVEIQRGAGAAPQSVSVGTQVFPSDIVRSGPNAAAKLIFVDDAVVNIGPSTELTIAHYAGGKTSRRALLKLAQGTIEALVSGYGGEAARYEVDTPTAIARVQGTDFVVRYDAAAQTTDVASLEGNVGVQGTTGIIGPGVVVAPKEMTRVPRDGFPSPAKAMDTAEAGALMQGLQLIGTGTREGLDTDNPILEGKVVGAADRPGEGATAPAPAVADAYLHPGVPGETLIQTLSPDIRANSQPLPEYRAVPPNAVPVPPH